MKAGARFGDAAADGAAGRGLATVCGWAARRASIVHRVMRQGLLSLRRNRHALRLAVFAVVAQVLLGLASAQHQVRMQAAEAWFREALCLPLGSPPIPDLAYGVGGFLHASPSGDADNPSLQAGAAYCAVCALAFAVPLPPPTAPAMAQPVAVPSRTAAPVAPRPPMAAALLRPPPRGPPFAA